LKPLKQFEDKKMAFKMTEGNPSLFRAIAISADQMAQVEAIKAFYKGETTLTCKQLLEASKALFDHKYMPYFIDKNLACKTKTRGLFDISKLKVAAGSVAKKTAKPAKKSTKKVVAKKESAPKRNRKAAKKEAPVAAAPVSDAPVGVEPVAE
jgi:hypothetical protein